MALPARKAREIAESCGNEYEILAAGVARLLVASPDPTCWTHTGLTGACVFIFNQSADHHLMRLYALDRHDLVWEFELYEDFSLQFVSDRLLAFEVDDFVMGLSFSLTTDAEEFFSAVQDEAPRSADSLQLVMFRDLENKQRLQKGGGLTRLFGWRKAADGASKPAVDAGALEEALQSAQGVEIVLNADGGIDVAALSPALRLVFKRAGIRKRDLRHRSTAAMLLAVLQEVGADISEAGTGNTSPPVGGPPSLAAFTIQEEPEGDIDDEDEEEGGQGGAGQGMVEELQQDRPAPIIASTTSTSAVQAPPALQTALARPALHTAAPAAAPSDTPSPPQLPAGAVAGAGAGMSTGTGASPSSAASPSPRTRTKRSSMAAFHSPTPLAAAASPAPVATLGGTPSPTAGANGSSPRCSTPASASPRTRRMSRRMVSAVHSAAASRQASMASLSEDQGAAAADETAGGSSGTHAQDATAAVRPSLSGAIAAATRARGNRVAGGNARTAQSLPPPSAGSSGPSLLAQIKAKGATKEGLRHVRRPTDARKSIVAKFSKQPGSGPGLLGQLQANLAHRRMFLKEESSDEEDSDSEWSD